MILAAPALFPARLLAFFLSLSVLRNAEGGERRMASGRLLLGYFLVKVLAWGCTAGGEPGQQLNGFLLVPGSNGSREADGSLPHTEDRCRGYYDVMGQWDPPFVCKTGNYLYCCGTCGFRFCCAFESSRLDQSTCKNYDTPIWMMTGQTPYKKNDPRHDPTKDKTNLIVYIICGVVAIMALVGIFTKLGLEKAHRPQRENMSRALASVMNQQGPCPGEHEDTLGMHHYENIQARTTANNLHSIRPSIHRQQPLVPRGCGEPEPNPVTQDARMKGEGRHPGRMPVRRKAPQSGLEPQTHHTAGTSRILQDSFRAKAKSGSNHCYYSSILCSCTVYYSISVFLIVALT